jgi:hypothetical protein
MHLTVDGDLARPALQSRDSDDYRDFARLLLDAPEEPHRVPLGEVATLREGSHAIRAVPMSVPREPSERETYPVVVDKSLGPLIPPDVGFIEPDEGLPPKLDHHEGGRFFLRKTGDRLVVALSPTDCFALAHQNVYVGKLRDDRLPLLTLVGILHSRLLTGLYRMGPGGQHHRPYAQLRLLFLNRLPIVVVPKDWELRARSDLAEIERLAYALKTLKKDSIPQVPMVFPSERAEADEVIRNISLMHRAIASLTDELIRRPNEEAHRALDCAVYCLYGGRLPE